ncbi:hypothetical protein TNCV_636341 [Trichonephila clavipes]|nr:hypothetical protein TNCV_636341 [Trichonephila clavipes]
MSKWRFSKNNVEVGTLVLIKNESLPGTKWLTGRILEVFYGNDNKIRVGNTSQTGVYLQLQVPLSEVKSRLHRYRFMFIIKSPIKGKGYRGYIVIALSFR